MNYKVGRWTLYSYGDDAMLSENYGTPIQISVAAAKSLVEYSQYEHRYLGKLNAEPLPDADKIRVLEKWLKEKTKELPD